MTADILLPCISSYWIIQGRPPFIYVPLAKEKMLGLESKDRLALAA